VVQPLLDGFGISPAHKTNDCDGQRGKEENPDVLPSLPSCFIVGRRVAEEGHTEETLVQITTDVDAKASCVKQTDTKVPGKNKIVKRDTVKLKAFLSSRVCTSRRSIESSISFDVLPSSLVAFKTPAMVLPSSRVSCKISLAVLLSSAAITLKAYTVRRLETRNVLHHFRGN